MTTARTTPSNSGKDQIKAVAINTSEATFHTCRDREGLTGLGRTDMNLSSKQTDATAQFGYECDSALAVDACSDPQLDG